MMPILVNEQAPVPPPSYQRAQARLGPALHLDASFCSHNVASAHALSPGCSSGLSSLSSALACRQGRSAAHVQRGELAADRLIAYLMALVVSGYARLVAELACFGPGLWIAIGQRGTAPYSEQIPTMQTAPCRRSPST